MNIVISANGGEKTEPVGAGQISVSLLSLERRVGHACKIAKWKKEDDFQYCVIIFFIYDENNNRNEMIRVLQWMWWLELHRLL